MLIDLLWFFLRWCPCIRLASNLLCTEGDFEHLILLPSPLKCWDYRHSPLASFMWCRSLAPVFCSHQASTLRAELHPSPWLILWCSKLTIRFVFWIEIITFIEMSMLGEIMHILRWSWRDSGQTLTGVIALAYQEWIEESSYNGSGMGLAFLALGDEQNGTRLVTLSEVNLKESHICWWRGKK